MTHEVVRVVAADHPALEGHFPGSPVVPGVVLLEEVLIGLAQIVGGIELVGFSRVKFSSPLRPDRPFTIRYLAADSPEPSFTCIDDGRTIAQGRMSIRSKQIS